MAARILLLGWDPDLLQLIRDFLSSSGYAVIEPQSDDEARRILETTHLRFPYFTRLDLKADRGRRPRDVMARDPDPKREVRR